MVPPHRFLAFAICCSPSVCLSSVATLSSATLVHPTQPIEIFGNISTAFGIGHPLTSAENFTDIVPGEASAGGVKHKRGSQI